MNIIGKTVDGWPVVSGLGELYFQDGIPLSVIFDDLKSKQIQPSFPSLYNEMKGNGMSHDRIIHLLNEHVFESYGKEYRDVVIERLETQNPLKSPT